MNLIQEEIKECIPPFGLGYNPSPAELAAVMREKSKRAKAIRENREYEGPPISPYKKTLNGYFGRRGETKVYLIFPEPWVDRKGNRYPGWEIFENAEIIVDEIEKVTLGP